MLYKFHPRSLHGGQSFDGFPWLTYKVHLTTLKNTKIESIQHRNNCFSRKLQLCTEEAIEICFVVLTEMVRLK